MSSQSSPRKRLIDMYQEIITTERKVELPRETLILTFKLCTYEGHRLLRINGSKCQYILDRFIMFKLEKYYEQLLGQKEYVPQNDIWNNFSDYFDYEAEGPLIVRDLRLVIQPISAVQCQSGTERYQNYNRRENVQLKYKIDYQTTISYLAFLVLSFMKRYRPLAGNNKDISLREEIVILLLQENSLALNIKAKQEMLSYFDFDFMDYTASHKGKQSLLNPYIYSQTRFLNAQYCQSVIFNPTIFTSQICNINMEKKAKFLLKGISGVGKSCSLMLLVQQCRLVTNFLYIDAAKFHFLVKDQKEFENTPKYIYISLSEHFDVQDYRALIECQIHPQLKKQFQGKNRQSFISSVISAYNQKLIRVIFVLDQINLYFSCIRKCDQIEQKREEERAEMIAQKANEPKNQQRMRSSSHQIKTQSGSSVYTKKERKKEKEYEKKIKYDDHPPEDKPSKLDNYQKDLNTFVHQFYLFHRELTQQKAKILYSSSSNFEKFVPKTAQPKWFLHGDPYINLDFNKFHSCEINMRQREPQVGLKELIDVIYFEMEMKLRQMDKHDMLVILQQEKKVITKSIPNHLYQMFDNLPIELTHLRISNYLRDKKNTFKRFSPQNTHLSQIKYTSKEILDNFQILLNKIIQSCLNEYANDFSRFLNKGCLAFVYEKYELFNEIKLYCQLNIDSRDLIRFKPQKFSLDNFHFDFDSLIDQDHGRIQNNQLVLNYSPEFFIQVADKIQRNFSVMDSILRKLIKAYGSINSVFGTMFDNCCTKILTYLNVSLTLAQMTYNLKSACSRTFQHFYPGQANVDIRHKFKDVFKVLENYEQWISASPSIKFSNLRASKSEYSSTSRCIDCLLIKKTGQDQYSLRTIDFAMTFFESKITQKINKAKIFFAQFFSNAKKANLKFTLEHFIIVRHHIAQSSQIVEFQELNCTITVVPILSMKVEYLKQQFNDKKIDECTRSLFKCFMESLQKDGRGQ